MSETIRQARHDLARELVVVARRWRAKLDERLRPLGIGEARWAALYWLSQTPGGMSQTALAERAGVENPTLVRTLDLLCDAGLVARRAAPNDRRAKLVALTPAAAPLIAQYDNVADSLRQELMSCLTSEEVAITLGALRKLRARIDGVEPPKDAAPVAANAEASEAGLRRSPAA